MSEAEHFIYQYEDNQRKIMLYFHDRLTREFDLIDKIRFKIPFYYGKSWICYLNPIENHSVELAFTRGNELSNSQGLLDNKGRKQVYGIEFEALSDIPIQAIDEIIHEALLLDETKPYASKRSSKKQ